MLVSNLNSWNPNGHNMTTTATNYHSNHDFISKEIYDKSDRKAARTIVFCKIKSPVTYSKTAASNTSNKLKKLVKFEDGSTNQLKAHLARKKSSIESKRSPTEMSVTRNFTSNSISDLASIKQTQSLQSQTSQHQSLHAQQQIQSQNKNNLSRAIDKKLIALNRYNSANSHNRLSLKDNIHNSFLSNGGSVNNPFASNLDMITKTNPNYSSLSKLTNRFETNTRYDLSRLESHYSSSNRLNNHNNNLRTTTPSETNYNPDYLTKVFELFSKNDESSHISLSRLTTNETNKSLNKLNEINKNDKKPNEDTKNYFLNYRLIKSDKENILNNIKLNNEYKNNLKLKATQTQATPLGQQPQNGRFDEDSSNDFMGNNKYLESLKYFYIKNWIDEVDRCQRTEGKCLETMNKIVCYDD